MTTNSSPKVSGLEFSTSSSHSLYHKEGVWQDHLLLARAGHGAFVPAFSGYPKPRSWVSPSV